MSTEEVKAIAAGTCPDCGGKLTEGPLGGMSINMLCYTCGARFNTLQSDFIPSDQLADSPFCERIGKMSPDMIKQMRRLYP